MFFQSLAGSGAPKVPSGVAGTGAAPSGSAPSGASPSDITGKFDPSALERGAKALRELDNSPNASRAFEITKLQEVTRQNEIRKEIEQLQSSRAQYASERARIEGDERRKTLTHQQEQERVTAQYKAQLEAEAYSKKLQDQQRQNEEWLQQQHQQFLRQEEVRKRTERELLELRRQQLEAEKAAQEDLARAKLQEEARGRILQERENSDVHLAALRAKAIEDRTTRLEVTKSIFGSLGTAAATLLDDRQKLTALATGCTAIAIGVYGARTGAGLLGRALEARIGKPPLVRESSRWSFARSWRTNLTTLLRGKPKLQEKIVLPRELSERVEWTTNSLISAKKNGTPFRHLLLYGQPGTGKTLLARTLAHQSGLDYAIMSGGDVGPLGKDAVAEINRLFRWATKSRKGLILFIDEAEAFLRQGRGMLGAMSEDMRNALSAFLHHTGTESDKFCVVMATNVREVLDKAVLDRVDEQFEFPLPGVAEREKMLQLFFAEHINRPTKRGKKIEVDPQIDNEFMKFIARRTADFSGRQLAKLVLAMQAAVFGAGTNTLTKGLAETVLNWTVATRGEAHGTSK